MTKANMFLCISIASLRSRACRAVPSKQVWLPFALLAGMGLSLADPATAQTLTTLHSFTASVDGGYPAASLVLSGNTLYGTTRGAGSDFGTVFAVNANGSGFTTLHTFTNGSDGGSPKAGLVLSGNTLYGTAGGSGGSDNGTVFAVNTDSLVFTTLYGFTNGSDGAFPQAGLILSGDTLYGTATEGGNAGDGTVFAVNTDGTCFTTLHSFSDGSDEAFPDAALIRSGNTLYGTTFFAGSGRDGTVFSLSLASVTAPQLSITLSGTNVVLTWPASPIEFTLQSTASLLSPAIWNTNLPLPVVVGGQNTVTNPISGTQHFYRLGQ